MDIGQKSDVKSTAIVKYSALRSPAAYSQLANNTDLNEQPPNWLRGRFGEPWIPSGRSSSKRENISLVMANSFVDAVGKVDVISEAENIKKLLKMPYSTAPISQLVHRVGKTLLIDNFDVYKHVLRVKEGEWEWMKNFIVDHVIDEKSESSLTESLVPAIPIQTRENLKEKVMLSKFLYHSAEPESLLGSPVKECLLSQKPTQDYVTPVPDPLESSEYHRVGNEETTSKPSVPTFEREVLWTFEDIKMLIGTDMPIFGGGSRPCVSLRLRDMKKPISILTGVDYWLDNLMCNVPDVVMCFHVDGIVQKYEHIKTEDLPNMSETAFSHELIRDVAQNILSFLKSNATKEGHTYWLFKGAEDEVVKLYDLTTLCPQYMNESDVNPFTLPVAVLMYRVARNLAEKFNKNLRRPANTIYKLLTDALELLQKEKHPQVVGSIHYLLASLYVGCADMSGFSSNPSAASAFGKTFGGTTSAADQKKGAEEWKFQYGTDDPSYQQYVDEMLFSEFDQCDWFSYERMAAASSSDVSGGSCISLDVLMRPTDPSVQSGGADADPAGSTASRVKPMPNCSNLDDSCKEALEHVFEGLECAEVMQRVREKVQLDEEEEIKNAKLDPQNPIPLEYQPLFIHQDGDARVLPAAVRKPLTTTWQLELTALLMVKAMSAYLMLVDCSSKLGQLGKSLRYIRLSLLCYETAEHLVSSAEICSPTLTQVQMSYQDMISALLTLAGDTHLNLAHQGTFGIKKYEQDYERNVYRDSTIANKAAKVLGAERVKNLKYGTCAELSDSIEKNLQLSVMCYEFARKEIRANQIPNGPEVAPADAGVTESLLEGMKVDSVMLTKRIGNVKNELGVYFLNLSSHLLESTKGDIDVESEEDSEGDDATPTKATEPPSTGVSDRVLACWKLSLAAFNEGIGIFQSINDKANEALLNSNCARLMRTAAAAYVKEDEEFRQNERSYLQQAVEFYFRALECVNKTSDPLVWESIAWETSSIFFNFALLLQERPPLSSKSVEEVEEEIRGFMHKSLKYVEMLDSPVAKRHEIYSYRAAVVHQKLASMYFRKYKDQDSTNERKAKHARSLAELHYAKAIDGFKELITESPLEFLRTALEQIALFEYAAETNRSSQIKEKNYCQALKLSLETVCVFPAISTKISEAASTLAAKKSSKKGLADRELLNELTENVPVSGSWVEIPKSGGETAELTNGLSNADHRVKLFVDETRKLSGFVFDRCQSLLKSLLQIRMANAKKSKNPVASKTAIDSLKDAYKVTLVEKPKKLAEWPQLLSDVIVKVEAILKRSDVFDNEKE